MPIREDFFIILKKKILKLRISEQNLSDRKIIISENLPWNRKDFTFFKDGVILEQDKDFTIKMNLSNAEDVKCEIILIRDDFEVDELVEFIWSYAEPYSAHSKNNS